MASCHGIIFEHCEFAQALSELVLNKVVKKFKKE